MEPNTQVYHISNIKCLFNPSSSISRSQLRRIALWVIGGLGCFTALCHGAADAWNAGGLMPCRFSLLLVTSIMVRGLGSI